MAKLCWKVKASRKPKFSTQSYTRCKICGRSRAVYRKFGMCRICLRQNASFGLVPGVTKASW